MNALKEHSDNHFSDCCTVQMDAKDCIFLLFLGRCKSLVQKCSSFVKDIKFCLSDRCLGHKSVCVSKCELELAFQQGRQSVPRTARRQQGCVLAPGAACGETGDSLDRVCEDPPPVSDPGPRGDS